MCQTEAPYVVCDCERPGLYHTGVPGVLAAMDGIRVACDAVVERCDQCCRFDSDEAAWRRLLELGVADANSQTLQSFDVHCVAVVRVTFRGVLAATPRQAAGQTLDRFDWATHWRQATVAGAPSQIVVDDMDEEGRPRTRQFDSELREVNPDNP